MSHADSIDSVPSAKHSAFATGVIHVIFKTNLALKILSLSTFYRLGDEGRVARVMLLMRRLRFKFCLTGDNQLL